MSQGSGVARTREQTTKTLFDRFAERCVDFVSKDPFFTFCVLLVVIWAPSYFFVGNFDTYHLLEHPEAQRARGQPQAGRSSGRPGGPDGALR
jgi:low affinity Fe/Cu permease